jgi:RND family efflux transporter MFP subunit
MESKVNMKKKLLTKKKLIITIGTVVLLLVVALGTCARRSTPPVVTQTAVVDRGDIMVTVTADGKLDMPHEAKLRFGTPGTVEEVYVDEGDKVREGTLLAKLDDASQKQAMASAQYDVELAMNQIVEKIPTAFMGYPTFYPDDRAALSVGEAQKELENVQAFLGEGKYQNAASELRMAQHDLESAYDILNDPAIKPYLEHVGDFGAIIQDYPEIPQAISLLEADLGRLASVQTLIEKGNYEGASAALQEAQSKLQETYQLVDSLTGRLRISQRMGCAQDIATQGQDRVTGLMPIPYSDTSTSLDWLRQVEDDLQEIQKLMQTGDQEKLAEKLRMAQHDAELSHSILENNELIFRSGMNLTTSRQLSLNLQKAELALQKAKDELMKTEILAPFDGTVVAVDVKKDDQLSAFDYSSKTAVHLVDTKTVKLDGNVDEVDIAKLTQDYEEKQKEGKKQEAAITVDAFPGKELMGYVTFISPFGDATAGVVQFSVTIALEPTDVELLGTLTATAEIIIGEKHANVIRVPSRAVKGTAGDYWVDVVVDEKTGASAKRPITLGLQSRNWDEVLSGLKEGEKVLLTTPKGSNTAST